jgi:(p)ppGpp synthase/HD superfamily hydrolase
VSAALQSGSFDRDRLSAAIAYGFAAHEGQTRKGNGAPYASHLLAVTALVLEYGGDTDQAMGAMLHDVIEDCGIAHESVIRDRFGARVAGIVRGCTDSDTVPKRPWQIRKDAYIAQMRRADADVLIVAGCDKLHNVRSIILDLGNLGGRVFSFFSVPRERTLWYYETVTAVIEARLPGAMARDLSRAVDAMRILAET